ncbi:3551_t:CDS:2, partial [Entrophospora sp. SA101]
KSNESGNHYNNDLNNQQQRKDQIQYKKKNLYEFIKPAHYDQQKRKPQRSLHSSLNNSVPTSFITSPTSDHERRVIEDLPIINDSSFNNIIYNNDAFNHDNSSQNLGKSNSKYFNSNNDNMNYEISQSVVITSSAYSKVSNHRVQHSHGSDITFNKSYVNTHHDQHKKKPQRSLHSYLNTSVPTSFITSPTSDHERRVIEDLPIINYSNNDDNDSSFNNIINHDNSSQNLGKSSPKYFNNYKGDKNKNNNMNYRISRSASSKVHSHRVQYSHSSDITFDKSYDKQLQQTSQQIQPIQSPQSQQSSQNTSSGLLNNNKSVCTEDLQNHSKEFFTNLDTFSNSNTVGHTNESNHSNNNDDGDILLTNELSIRPRIRTFVPYILFRDNDVPGSKFHSPSSNSTPKSIYNYNIRQNNDNDNNSTAVYQSFSNDNYTQQNNDINANYVNNFNYQYHSQKASSSSSISVNNQEFQYHHQQQQNGVSGSPDNQKIRDEPNNEVVDQLNELNITNNDGEDTAATIISNNNIKSYNSSEYYENQSQNLYHLSHTNNQIDNSQLSGTNNNNIYNPILQHQQQLLGGYNSKPYFDTNNKMNRRPSIPAPITTSKRFSNTFKKSKKQHPKYQEATLSLQNSQYQSAIRLYSEILTQIPNSYSLKCDRAFAYLNIDEFALALCDLDDALVMKPKKSRAWEIREEVFRLQIQYEDVLVDQNKCLRIQPNNTSQMHKYEMELQDLSDSGRIPTLKGNLKKKECIICVEERPPKSFVIISNNCNHNANICDECVNKYIEGNLNDKGDINIKCPFIGCDVILDNYEIKNLVNDNLYQRYDELALRKALQQMPDIRWCKNPKCKSAQSHIGSESEPILTCRDCGTKSCFTHDSLWHEGLTCQQYDKIDKNKNKATQKYLAKHTKPCPKCGVRISKNEGCDHMTCKVPECKYEFCWL